MALSTLASATDAIPLLDETSPGNGIYLKGRNNAQGIRRQLLGALFAKSSSSYAWRTGVFVPGSYNTTAAVYEGLRAIPLGSPGQGIQILQGHAIQDRTGQGPYLISLDGTLTSVSMPAADGSNPRWDVVYAYAYDQGAFPADAQHGPKLLVETGTPGSSPSVPSIPADAVKIAEVFRRTIGATPSGNIIQAADIVDKRRGTGLHGAPRALLPGDALTDAGGYHGELRLRAGAFVPAGINPRVLIDYWDAEDSKWHGTQTVSVPAITQSFSGSIANEATQTIASVVISDLGWDWTLDAAGGYEYLCNDADALVGCQVTVDSTAMDANVAARGLDKSPGGAGASKYAFAIPTRIAIPTAATRTIRLLAKNYNSAAGVTVASGGQYGFKVDIVPI